MPPRRRRFGQIFPIERAHREAEPASDTVEVFFFRGNFQTGRDIHLGHYIENTLFMPFLIQFFFCPFHRPFLELIV